MRSATSWFNSTLYKKNLTRFWPIWALYLVIWLFVFPISLILNNHSAEWFAHREVLEAIPELSVVAAVGMSLLVAMAVWSYFCNHRSACLMHGLPIRREGLFLTNFLSGMTMMVGPNVIVFVLTLLAEVGAGEVSVKNLAIWLVSITLMELFFFGFASFCAMFTGHILGLPIFYAILNVLVVGLVSLTDLALSRFVFGYNNVGSWGTVTEWLTPVAKLVNKLRVVYEYNAEGARILESGRLAGFGCIAVCAVVGLIFAALALVVYRRRQMETAGDVVTVRWVRPVFQYGVAFCCALAFGTLLFELFRGALSETAWTLLAFMMICGAAGYFIAKMLLEKSFRVFRCWKGCVPFLAALVLLVCVMEFDLIGYERRVPAEENIVAVRMNGISNQPYDDGSVFDIRTEDPAVIHAIRTLHQTVVQSKKEIEKPDNEVRSHWEERSGGYEAQVRGRKGFVVEYELANGKVVRRNYSDIPVSVQDMTVPGTISAQMDALINHPQFIKENYSLYDERTENVIEMALRGVQIVDEGGMQLVSYNISKDAYADVLNAVIADLEEGNLGRRYLLEDDEYLNTCLENELRITFYRREESQSQTNVTEPTIEVWPMDMPVEEKGIVSERVRIDLQTTARHTLAALRRVGVLTGPITLLTQAQYRVAEGKWHDSGYTWSQMDLDAYAWDVVGTYLPK